MVNLKVMHLKDKNKIKEMLQNAQQTRKTNGKYVFVQHLC